MHERVYSISGSSNPVSAQYLFLVTMREKGIKNRKALKNQGFSRLYLFYSPFLVAEVGFFIALHQIIVVARRNHRLLLQLLDLAVSAAQKRSTGAFLLAYPLPPPPAAIGGRGIVQSPPTRAKRTGHRWCPVLFGCGGGI